jgi:hypothetical protein
MKWYGYALGTVVGLPILVIAGVWAYVQLNELNLALTERRMAQLKAQGASKQERIRAAEAEAQRLIGYLNPPWVAYRNAYRSLHDDRIAEAYAAIAHGYMSPDHNNRQDWCEAFVYFHGLAVVGDLEGLRAVSNAYLFGLGAPQDTVSAYQWALRLKSEAESQSSLEDIQHAGYVMNRAATVLSPERIDQIVSSNETWPPEDQRRSSPRFETPEGISIEDSIKRFGMLPCDLQTGLLTMLNGAVNRMKDERATQLLIMGETPLGPKPPLVP